MTTYRRKPQLIEAFQWTGGIDQTEDPVWAVEAIRDGRIWFQSPGTENVVMEIGGLYAAIPGDWITKNEEGHIQSFDPADFVALYEPA